MADIVIGAQSEDEALQQIRRVQVALERVGLYPNTAKTRVLPRDLFVGAYLKDENDYLGEVDGRLDKGLAVDVTTFHQRLRRHLPALVPRRGAPVRSALRTPRRPGPRHLACSA